MKLIILTLAAAVSFCVLEVYAEEELLLITVATEENDGFRRYLRSIKKYNLDYKVLGLGETWKGGDMTNEGGGHKVNLLKEGLVKYRNRDDLILMFTDSYDVVFTAGKEDILAKFHKLDARVIFSAEPFCWPDRSLAVKYPEVKIHEKKYLCSGGFMGYARDIYEIVSYIDIDNTADDQLYYTDIFLKESLREKWNMKLDKRSDIFMNLHGALEEVMMKFKGSHSYLFNVKTGTQPVVIHGNGPIKPEFNRLANYLADSWTTSNGCMACEEDLVNLDGMKEDDYPTIVMGLFFEEPTPFVREFLEKIALLDYPKQRIDLFVHNNVGLHTLDMKKFLEVHGGEYRSTNIILPDDRITETIARNWALEECEKKDCKYYFSVDGDAQLDNDQSLKLLVQQNRTVLAPMVARWGKAWSNFWGALSETGFYARSEDYMDIVHLERKGVWNVPYITAVYLVQGHVIPNIREAYTSVELDPDMAFCKTLREKGHFLFVTNLDNHGHMINKDDSDMTHKNNELYELINNPYDWEKRYLHPNYSNSLKEDAIIEQPCPDVFWFPIVTEQFCDDLVDEMEHFGQWSGGKAEDKRLAGGYENVPTDDIHMNQIGLETQWLKLLADYVAPLATKVYPGYYSHSKALLNFVVKYHPDRQRELRPHHDSSTFTINIALNHPLVDFEGGGCRFIRYNCSVTSTRKGWMLMHPGRLTHFHEGLQVTKGTRYIMVSFVDP